MLFCIRSLLFPLQCKIIIGMFFLYFFCGNDLCIMDLARRSYPDLDEPALHWLLDNSTKQRNELPIAFTLLADLGSWVFYLQPPQKFLVCLCHTLLLPTRALGRDPRGNKKHILCMTALMDVFLSLGKRVLWLIGNSRRIRTSLLRFIFGMGSYV